MVLSYGLNKYVRVGYNAMGDSIVFNLISYPIFSLDGDALKAYARSTVKNDSSVSQILQVNYTADIPDEYSC